eukprot:GHVN01098934.1.p1 GENE.GHVN01098934.1~~GHVN01098934.1.p1  ORF type:complete len:195 (-),score=13.97 GHVN01098934.1:33-617(-)
MGPPPRINVGRTEVKVHVYDLMLDQAPFCGAFHTGVEVRGVEYSFAENAGVYEGRPKGASGCYYRETLDLGATDLQIRDVYRVLDELKMQFPGEAYDLVENNCNDFSDAFCRRLVGHGLPPHINRLAWWSRCCRCLYPRNVKDASPNTYNRSAQSGPQGQRQSLFVAFQGRGNTLGGDGPPPANHPLLGTGGRR